MNWDLIALRRQRLRAKDIKDTLHILQSPEYFRRLNDQNYQQLKGKGSAPFAPYGVLMVASYLIYQDHPDDHRHRRWKCQLSPEVMATGLHFLQEV